MAYTLNKINFGVYIYKVLKEVHPDAGISSDARQTVNNIVKDFIGKVAGIADKLVMLTKRNTITSWEIQSAVRILLPNDRLKDALSAGTKAVTKFNDSVSVKESLPVRVGPPKKKSLRGHSTSASARAELTFSVARVKRAIRALIPNRRVGVGAPVYLAAVLEHLVAHILELAGISSRDNKRVRVTSRDITLGIRADEGFNKLFASNKFVLGGGVVPYIDERLLKGKSKRVSDASREAYEQLPASKKF